MKVVASIKESIHGGQNNTRCVSSDVIGRVQHRATDSWVRVHSEIPLDACYVKSVCVRSVSIKSRTQGTKNKSLPFRKRRPFLSFLPLFYRSLPTIDTPSIVRRQHLWDNSFSSSIFVRAIISRQIIHSKSSASSRYAFPIFQEFRQALVCSGIRLIIGRTYYSRTESVYITIFFITVKHIPLSMSN